MENNEKALEALRKIENVINEVRDLFPTIKKKQVKITVIKRYNDPLEILKRINGIIMNYNESNAQGKLENLLKFLGMISSEEK